MVTREQHDGWFMVVRAVVLESVHAEAMLVAGVEESPGTTDWVVMVRL